MYEQQNTTVTRNDKNAYLYARTAEDIAREPTDRNYAYPSQRAELSFTQDGRAFFVLTGRWCLRYNNGAIVGTAMSKAALLNGWY